MLPQLIFTFEWEIEIVDPYDQPTHDNSIAIDSNNYPHIAYWALDLNSLKYTYFDGLNWNIQVPANGGAWNSIKLNSQNNPYISHMTVNTPGNKELLLLSRWYGTGWITEIVDTVVAGNYTSLCLDSNGYPHIAYGYNGYYIPCVKLKYANFNGSSWEITTVDSADIRFSYDYPSLQLDSIGNPHIAFTYFKGGPIPACTAWVKYAYWNSSSWQIETIDYGGQPTLKFDSNGSPRIFYRTGSEVGDFWIGYARKIGSDWQITYFYYDYIKDNPKFDIDSNDFNHLIYTAYDDNPSQSRIMYLILNDTTLLYYDTVYITGRNVVHASLTLDSRDLPHISAIDNNIFSLIYAKGNLAGIEEKKPLSKTSSKLFSQPTTFKHLTNIFFEVDNPSCVNLHVYNIKGELVRELESGYKPSGCYKTFWDGRDESGMTLPTGIYFLKLETKNNKITNKIIFIK
jgi:hypothetical protein